MHGSLKTKELKKKHSFRLLRGAETGSQGREDAWQSYGWRNSQVRQWMVNQGRPGGGWQTRQSHLCADKMGGTTREHAKLHNPGVQHREIKPQNLWL